MGMYSEYLLDQLEDFCKFVDEEEQKDSEMTDEDREAVKFVLGLCRLMVEGKTQWLEPRHLNMRQTLEDFEAVFDKFEDEVDRLLTRRALEEVNVMARRLRGVPSIFLVRYPPAQVRNCLREATRCYLYGLFQASAVLSRVTLERALEDRLRARGANVLPMSVQAHRRKDSVILNLLDRAREERVIGGEDFERLNKVREIGNNAAHGRPVEGSDARSALANLRGVLERIYR